MLLILHMVGLRAAVSVFCLAVQLTVLSAGVYFWAAEQINDLIWFWLLCFIVIFVHYFCSSSRTTFKRNIQTRVPGQSKRLVSAFHIIPSYIFSLLNIWWHHIQNVMHTQTTIWTTCTVWRRLTSLFFFNWFPFWSSIAAN